MTVIATPSKTFALVVGIAKYKEPSWNVKSGATVKGALKFTNWLLEQGVPESNIKLCLSPIEENTELLNSCQIAIETAELHNITDIIDNLSEQTGDLLYIYWAGHGLITSNRERRLLCAG